MAKNLPELISATFALNEGGGGRTDGHGKLEVMSIQVGEKADQNSSVHDQDDFADMAAALHQPVRLRGLG